MKIGYDLSLVWQEMSGTERLEYVLRTLAENGYDYVEIPVTPLANMTEEACIQVKEILSDSGMPVLVGSGLLPPSSKLTGSEADFGLLVAHIHLCFQRFRALGGKTIVIRDGQARSMPKHVSRQEALEQLEKLLQMCDELAEPLGLTVALEPLNRKETNLVKRLEDALELTAGLYLPNVRLAADPYHLYMEREEFDIVEEVIDMELLEHLHVTVGEDGLPLQDGTPYETFFEAVKRAGYNGTISVSGSCLAWSGLPVSSAAAIQYMRALWRSA